jgi:hypothetical protein
LWDFGVDRVSSNPTTLYIGWKQGGSFGLTVTLNLADEADILAASVATFLTGNPEGLTWYRGDRVSKPTLTLPKITGAVVTSWKWTYDDEELTYATTDTLVLNLNSWLTDGVHYAGADEGEHLVEMEIVVNGKLYNGRVPITIKAGTAP